ncbi:SDR family oxidoreductase [Microvirga antarctica]|uniref:SDR family oxidoreductase n=1 Tax=Microvirga antarctica TaxID=2819233 RepID=UPI001B303353|nr:SDR family oxidoreductase [Microvirga antarctica]
MDLKIGELRAIVTAGASGIGLAIAKALVEEGARVHLCDIDPDALATARAALPTVSTSVCDVSDRAAVTSLFDDALTSLGGLDCLVNNAGVAGPTGRVDAIDPEAWDQTLAVNITGQFNCARLAVSHLAKSPNASIINLSSAAGRLGFGLRSPYAASKWAVVGFTKSLSIELAELGIRVNAILPGAVEGDRQNRVLAAKAVERHLTLDVMKREALERASIKEFITPQQLSDAILFLASPRSRTTSGQAISICGDLQSLT